MPDRRDVANEIEIELFIERRVDGVCRTDHEEGIAVRWRTHDRLCPNIGATARTGLNEERLAQALGQPLAHQTRQYVSRAAGSRRDDEPDWPRRIGLRSRNGCHGRQRGGACGEMQKLAAGRFHGDDPSSAFAEG